MSTQSFKVKSGLTISPVDLTTLTNPQAGDLACDINDNNKIKRYDANAAAWVEVGSGGVGGVDIFFVQDFESASLSSFTQTGLVLSQTDPLKGKVSAVLNHQAGTSPANDQSFKQIISVDRKFRGQTMVMRLDSKSDASQGNLVINVKDETNNANLVASEQLQLSNEVSGKKTSVSFTIPETCASLSYTITALPESGKVSRIDDIICELAETALLETSVEVPVVTGWQGYTPTFQGFGTPTNVEFEWRQVGENVEIRGKFTSGTSTAVEARVGLPAGLTSAGTSLIPSIQQVGFASRGVGSANSDKAYSVLVQPSVGYINFAFSSYAFAQNPLVAQNGDFLIANGVSLSFFASVPCAGLSATTTKTIPLTQSGLVQEADSQLYAAGNAGQSITANVTDIPFTLVSNLGSDIQFNGSSFVALSSGIYNISGNVFFTATTTTAIELYVNGISQSRLSQVVSSNNFHFEFSGYFEEGDVVSVRATVSATLSNTSTYHYLNVTKQGSLKQVSVSSDQKITIPTSELRFEGASSRGAVATAIVKFDTLAKIRGDAFTVVSTANDGTYVQMNKAGRLNVGFSLVAGNGVGLSLTKNQATLTSSAPAASELLATTSTTTAGAVDSASWCGDVVVGDIIRVCASGNPAANNYNTLSLSFQEQEIAVSVTNTLPQFSESDSSVRVDTANGYGSTATKIRRFSNLRDNIGTDIEYADSATNGASFTIKTSGVYNISYNDCFTTLGHLGISRNASSLTTNITGLPFNEVLALEYISTNTAPGNASWQGYLNVGDIIRPHTTGLAASTDYIGFTISKVGKPNVTGVDVTPFVNVPQPESQSSYVNFGAFAAATLTGALSYSIGSGLYSYNSSTGIYTVLKRANYTLTLDGTTAAASQAVLRIYVNSSNVASQHTDATAGRTATTAYTGALNAGDTFYFSNDANSVSSARGRVLATALSDQILTAPETFSTDTAALVYAPSSTYTLSTLANAPVGTYITFTYAANTNTRTQTTTRPTQTDADMNANGIQIFARAYNAASTSGNPSAIAIQIGKGLKGVSQSLYKSAGKVTSGSIDSLCRSTTTERGINSKNYNEITGILYLDAGVNQNTTTTSYDFLFDDITVQTSGYLVINASKNASLTGMNIERVSARAVNSAGTTYGNTEAVLVYDAIKTYDTHGALNTSTGEFTAPESGYYEVSATVMFANAAYTATQFGQLNVFKNNVWYATLAYPVLETSTSNVLQMGGSTGIYLSKGDKVSIFVRNSRGSTALSNFGERNYFSIHKTNIGGRN